MPRSCRAAACGRYLLQTGLPFSQATILNAMAPTIWRSRDHSLRLFEARLDPDLFRRVAVRRRATRIIDAIARRLESVADADEDRILRAFLAVVLGAAPTTGSATPRAARRCRCAEARPCTASLGCHCPARVFVVTRPRSRRPHLDEDGGGARFGIRWSDRRGHRVLGLRRRTSGLRLIVPVGAKVGFVPRRRLAERAA